MPHEPEGEPDAANLEFSDKQVDLALEHLRDEKDKQNSELLDRLGWTKEEAEKFLENMKKLKDSAQQPGSDGRGGQEGLQRVLEEPRFCTRMARRSDGADATDDLQNVHDSGQMEPPADWADLLPRLFASTTAGQK